MDNLFAITKRAEKVDKLVNLLRSKGFTTEDLSVMGDSDWDVVANEARVRKPSDVSRLMVALELRKLELADQRKAVA